MVPRITSVPYVGLEVFLYLKSNSVQAVKESRRMVDIMKKSVGFIGCGNMAQAMIGGIVKSNLIDKSNIIASNLTQNMLDKVSKEHGINTTLDNKEVASKSDMIVLSVKPNNYLEVLNEIKDCINDEKIIVIIAAGTSIKFVENQIAKKVKIIRTMPNIASFVNEGMTALCHNDMVTEDDLKWVIKIFEGFGMVEVLDEKLMNAMPSINASSPAYVFMFIKALARGAVLSGMSEDKALQISAQSVLGSAKMIIETGKSCEELMDMVCSPKGCTIEALNELERYKFSDAVVSAINVCTDKVEKMSN